MTERNWMAIKTSSARTPGGALTWPVTTDDVPRLAVLMDRAYRGTIDHEGETLDQCADEMRATIEGKYGSLVERASNFISTGDAIASACLVTMYEGRPLIAFSMTDPSQQRKGYSAQLIREAIRALASEGQETLYLVVTEGNESAQALYRKLGFKDLGRALPKQPPPQF